jgi:hypothetical protein
MLTALMVLLRSIGLICYGHRAIALENLALRQQVAVLTGALIERIASPGAAVRRHDRRGKRRTPI